MPTDIPNDNFFLASLGSHSHDVVLATRAEEIDDPAGPQIVFCNAAFENMTGWSRQEVMGLTPRILQTENTNRTELDKIRSALIAWNEGDESAKARVELLNQRKNGEHFWVEIEMFPIWDAAYTHSYWVAVQRDISQRIAREELLRNALDETEKARSLQEKFLANMSHEFRTPLNAISGFADLLRTGIAGQLTDQQSEYVNAIFSSSQHLGSLVNDFLDYAAAMQDKIEIEIERLSSTTLINYVATIASHHAKKRDISLEADTAVDLQLLADETRARQCLTNLVDNAIKYSDPGTTVRISATERGGKVILRVADEGPGLSPEETTAALTMFAQLNRSKGGNTPGLGLGLPLTLHLMQKQHGSLHVDSTPGSGSVFSLEFPAAPKD